MPLVKNAVGILRHDNVRQRAEEREAERLDLPHGVACAGPHRVHGSNGQSSGGGSGEDQVELSRHVDDEEFAKRHGGKEAEEGADDGDGEDPREVGLGILGEEAQPVHGGQAGDKDARHAAGAGGRSLNDGVFLGAELHPDQGDAREKLCEEGDDAVAEDGAEHCCAEGEARLETWERRVKTLGAARESILPSHT